MVYGCVPLGMLCVHYHRLLQRRRHVSLLLLISTFLLLTREEAIWHSHWLFLLLLHCRAEAIKKTNGVHFSEEVCAKKSLIDSGHWYKISESLIFLIWLSETLQMACSALDGSWILACQSHSPSRCQGWFWCYVPVPTQFSDTRLRTKWLTDFVYPVFKHILN